MDEVEPGCSEPHRWLGGYEHLKRAIELAPDNELARRKLVVLILGRVGFASYELPVGYLGAAHEARASRELHFFCPCEGDWRSISFYWVGLTNLLPLRRAVPAR